MKLPSMLLAIFFIVSSNAKAQCTYLEVLSKPNKVINGDFSSGNTAFTSSLTYSTVNPLSEAKYVITTNAANVHFAFSGGDHTTGSGNFMVLNGSATPSNVWNQTVTVLPNTWYNFSAWFKNIVTKPSYAGAPIATVELWINGVKISRNMSLPDYPDVWKLLDTSWFSGSSTSANLTIRNIGIDLHGNDFAIDDIAFKDCCSLGNKTNLTSCIGSTLTLPGTGSGGTIVWSPTTGLNNPSLLTPSLVTNTNAVYILTRTNGTCITRDTFNITVENCCFSCNSLPSTLGNGLVACYPFDGNANDATTNNNHGTVNGATLTADRFGRPNRAYNFNGSSYIQANNSASLSSASTAITFAFWSRISSWVPQSGVNWASVISKSSSTTDCAYRFTIRQDGGSIIHNGKLWDYIPGAMSNVLNQWDFYAATVVGTTMKLYKNGVLMGSSTSSSPFTFNNSNPLNIGRDFPGILDYFNGSLDDIRIYNRALTDSEIRELFVYSSTLTLPTANAGTDINLCANDSFQLNGIANTGIYNWTPSNALFNSSALQTKGKVNSSTQFMLTNTLGTCVARDSVMVNLTGNSIEAGRDTVLCTGSSVQLNATGTGTIQWLPSTGLSSSTILNPIATPTATTVYVLKVTQGSCVNYDTIVVAVENCCFTCATMPSSIGNGLVACYPFSGNAKDGSGFNNHATVINATLTTDRFNQPNSAYIFSSSSNSRIVAPHSASLNNPLISICAWVQYGNTSTSQIITKRNWSNAANEQFAFDTKDFYVKRNGGCAADIGWNAVHYTTPPTVGEWTFICATYDGRYSKFYKNGVLQVTQDFGSTQNMDVCGGGELIIGATWSGFPFYFTGKIDDIRIYNRALSDAEVNQIYLFSASNTIPTVNAGTNISLCASDSFQLNGSGNGSMLWSPAAPLADATKLNTKGKISANQDFILTNTFGSCIVRDTVAINLSLVTANAGPDRQICKRDVIVLNGSGTGSSYSWLPIKNISNNLSLTPSVNPDTTTTYILSVTQGSCVVRDTVTVFVNPIDARILTNDTLFCVGDTITLRGIATGTSFDWYPKTNMLNATSNTPMVIPNAYSKYYLSTTDGTCIIVDSVTLSLSQLSVFAGIDTLICVGDSIRLEGIAPLNSTYLWTPSIGLDNTTIYNPMAFPSVRTEYILTATKGNCKGSDTVAVLVNDVPIVDVGADVKYCFGDDVKINVNASKYTDILWSPSTGIDDIKLLNPTFFGAGVRNYVIQLNNGKCVAFDTIKVSSNPKVIADFDAATENGIAPVNIEFTNKSSNASFYSWDFGDNSTFSTLIHPKHEFTNIGKFNVWLFATDSLGCKDSIYKTITITDLPFLKVPNVFTPDANSINDSFGVVYNASAFEVLTYRIYNRWGGFIYETTFPNGKWWDGTFEGKPCPDGVYFYILYAKSFSGKEFDLSGTVTLLR